MTIRIEGVNTRTLNYCHGIPLNQMCVPLNPELEFGIPKYKNIDSSLLERISINIGPENEAMIKKMDNDIENMLV